MRFLLISVVFLFPISAVANPNFILLRQNGNLVIYSDKFLPTYYTACPGQSWYWEGHSTSCSIETNVIRWKIDIIGPDWLYVTLSFEPKGVHLKVSRSNGSFEDDSYYDSYDDLLQDQVVNDLVVTLLERIGQNPHIPEIKNIQSISYGIDEISSPEQTRNIKDLIERIGNDSYVIREQAFKELKNHISQLRPILKDLSLSCEQQSRIDTLYSMNNLCLFEREIFEKNMRLQTKIDTTLKTIYNYCLHKLIAYY